MTETSHKDFDLSSLLHPAQAFRSPMDVVGDLDLTTNEKRAILASWASNACAVAVEDALGLRRPANARRISFDDVMDALKRLDGAEVDKPAYRKLITRAQRLKTIFKPAGGNSSATCRAMIVLDRRRTGRQLTRLPPRGHGGD